MIEIVALKHLFGDIKVTYIDEVKTYNIVTEIMSDNCMNYRVEQSAMIWLNDQGEIGEIESIYPKIIKESPCVFSKNIKYKKGLPLLQVISDSPEFCIENIDNGFIMWFEKEKEIDLKIECEDISFFIQGNELLGIACTKINFI